MNVRNLNDVLRGISDWTSYFDSEQNEIELTDVNQLDWAGDSPLHIAAVHGDTEAIRVLVENGAELNARGENGLTPFHAAFMSKQAEAIKMLSELGADPNAIDAFGKKPQDWSL
jgi:uncharacterized protein